MTNDVSNGSLTALNGAVLPDYAYFLVRSLHNTLNDKPTATISEIEQYDVHPGAIEDTINLLNKKLSSLNNGVETNRLDVLPSEEYKIFKTAGWDTLPSLMHPVEREKLVLVLWLHIVSVYKRTKPEKGINLVLENRVARRRKVETAVLFTAVLLFAVSFLYGLMMFALTATPVRFLDTAVPSSVCVLLFWLYDVVRYGTDSLVEQEALNQEHTIQKELMVSYLVKTSPFFGEGSSFKETVIEKSAG